MSSNKSKKKPAAKSAKYHARESDLVPLMVRVPRKNRAKLQAKAAKIGKKGVSVNCYVNTLIDRDLAA